MLFFIFIQILIEFSANSCDPDNTPHAAVSDLGLHCSPMSHKRMLGLYGFKSALKLNTVRK